MMQLEWPAPSGQSSSLSPLTSSSLPPPSSFCLTSVVFVKIRVHLLDGGCILSMTACAFWRTWKKKDFYSHDPNSDSIKERLHLHME